jgi:hypothetical protein
MTSYTSDIIEDSTNREPIRPDIQRVCREVEQRLVIRWALMLAAFGAFVLVFRLI